MPRADADAMAPCGPTAIAHSNYFYQMNDPTITQHQTPVGDTAAGVKLHDAYAGTTVGALLAFVLLCAALWAAWQAGWWSANAWTSTGRNLFFVSVAAVALPLLVLPARWLAHGAAALGLLLAALGFGLPALIGAAAVVLCGLRIGTGIQDLLQRLCPGPTGGAPPVASSLVELALGLAAIALTVNGLALVPINSTGLYATLALAVLGLGWRALARRLAELSRAWRGMLNYSTWRSSLPARLTLALASLYIVVASFPEVGHDALSMHLAVPAVVEQEGRWNFDVTRFVWAVMPMNVNWLYVAASFLGGESAARLLNLCALLTTTLALFCWGQARFGRAVASTAVLLWLTLPLLFALAASAFVDLPLTMLCAAALWAFERAATGGRRADWATAGILMGSAVAAKLPALLLAPPLAAIWLLSTVRAGRGRVDARWSDGAGLVSAATAVALACLFAAPPYLMAWLKTGNPVFPFFNSVFRSPLFPVDASFTNPLFVHPLGIGLVPDLFLHSQRFIESTHGGALGLGLLVAMPLALGMAVWRRQALVLALLFIALTYCALVFREQVYLRYVVPVLPLLCLAGGWGMVAAAGRGAAGIAICVVVAVGMARLPVAWWPLPGFPVWTALSAERRSAYLLRTQPEQLAATALRALSEGSDKGTALLGVTPVVARAPSGVVSDSWHSQPLFQALQATSPTTALIRLYKSGVGWIVLPSAPTTPALEAVRTASTLIARFGPTELRQLSIERLPMREVVVDPDLREPARFWGIEARPGGGAEVRLDHPATQRVELAGVPMLVVEHEYRCGQKTTVRSQVNWHDASGKFLSTSIEVAGCDADTRMRRSVVVPPDASYGIVYGVPHEQTPVLLRRLSVQAPDLAMPAIPAR